MRHAEIELTFDATMRSGASLRRVRSPSTASRSSGDPLTDAQIQKQALLEEVRWDRQFSLVPADRMPRIEATDGAAAGRRRAALVVLSSWSPQERPLRRAECDLAGHDARARTIPQFMAGPPLHRPAFRVVEEPHTGIRDLREWLPPPLDAHDVSLDLAGPRHRADLLDPRSGHALGRTRGSASKSPRPTSTRRPPAATCGSSSSAS